MSELPYFIGGEIYEARICAYSENVPGPHCGEQATIHVFWNSKGNNSYVCEEHKDEVIQRGQWYRWHYMGSYCGMPGAAFVPILNLCDLPQGIPVANKKEAET